MSATAVESAPAQDVAGIATFPGMRKNGASIYTHGVRLLALTRPTGKQWHGQKKAFRPASGLTSYEKRARDRVAQAAMKAKEKELKEEKEAERKVHTPPAPGRINR